jgi:hypothetical protein
VHDAIPNVQAQASDGGMSACGLLAQPVPYDKSVIQPVTSDVGRIDRSRSREGLPCK